MIPEELLTQPKLTTKEGIRNAVAQEVNYILGPLEPVQVPDGGFTSDGGLIFPALAGYCNALVKRITPEDSTNGEDPFTSHPYLHRLSYFNNDRSRRDFEQLDRDNSYLLFYRWIDQNLKDLQPGEFVPTSLTMLLLGGTYGNKIIESRIVIEDGNSPKGIPRATTNAYRQYLTDITRSEERTLRVAILEILDQIRARAVRGPFIGETIIAHVQKDEMDFNELLRGLVPNNLLEYAQEEIMNAITATTLYQAGSIAYSQRGAQYLYYSP